MDEYRITVEAGTELFHQGDQGDCAYIIERGEVLITADGALGDELELALLGSGSVLGEMALIDGRPRTATARVTETAQLVIIPKSHFSRLIEQSDTTVNMLMQVVLRRYRDIVAGIKMPSATSTSESDLIGQATLAAERVARESDLANALKSNHLHLFYQPIVNSDSGEIVGCEALIRWLDPQQGIIPPNLFIALAEESGLIVPIGHMIFENAYRAALELERVVGKKLWVSINLSGRQISDPAQVEELFDFIKAKSIDLSYLKIEVTETLLMSEDMGVAEILQRFRTLGAQVSLDDFGTGYSSFSYLHQYPIDTIKIDQSFVFSMDSNRKSEAIVRSLCSLAQSLNISTVAEGVETAGSADQLRKFGCNFSQGYLYSKPVPLGDFLDLLAVH